jgi:hypothetical protein
MKYINPHHKITSWVAIVIVISVGTFFTYFIWAGANESWGYDYIYPQFNEKISRLITSVETLGWKTHRDEGYGFQLRHPDKYSKTISTIATNSVLGTPGNPVAGASVGPLIFIKADTAKLRKAADAKFNFYWNFKGQYESPDEYCNKGVVQNTNLDIRVASCLIVGKKTNYALIKGKTFDIFVDGSTSGFDKTLLDTYGPAGKAISQAELTQILSTFEFITPSAN